MLLGTIIQQVESSIQHAIDYSFWLQKGETLANVTFTVDAGTATVSNVSYTPDRTEARFFLDGGSLGDQFNIIAEATTSFGQVRYDHIQVYVETNGGSVVLAGNNALMLSILGPTGSSGPTGPGGSVSGSSGGTGPTGPTGLQGAASTVTGPTGYTGLQGAASTVTGPTGSTGPQGNAGAASTVTGPTGYTGLQGAASTVTGPTGPTGNIGSTGSEGAQGIAGALGETGPQGVQGLQGVQGNAGATGPTGAASTVTGPTGYTGVAGTASTVTGPTGYTGVAGAAANTGATGPAGSLGPTGPTGYGSTGSVFWLAMTGTTAMGASTVTIPFNYVQIDTQGAYNTSTLLYTPKIPGYYSFSVAAEIEGTAAPGYAYASIIKNTSAIALGTLVDLTVGNAPYVLSLCSTIVYMNGTTDYVYFTVTSTLATPSLLGNNPPNQVYAYGHLIPGYGFTGPTGFNGTIGGTGPTGPTGIAGAATNTGATGLTGPTGSLGTGPTGATGPQGVQGAQGPGANSAPQDRVIIIPGSAGQPSTYLQWGTFVASYPTGNTTITFPVAFPNVCTSIMMGSSSSLLVGISSVTVTSFVAGPGSTLGTIIYWQALGY